MNANHEAEINKLTAYINAAEQLGLAVHVEWYSTFEGRFPECYGEPPHWPKGTPRAHVPDFDHDIMKIARVGWDVYWAKHFGFPTVEAFRVWWDWMIAGRQCTGATTKGTRCKNAIWNLYADGRTAHPFVTGVDDRCELHGGPQDRLTHRRREEERDSVRRLREAEDK